MKKVRKRRQKRKMRLIVIAIAIVIITTTLLSIRSVAKDKPNQREIIYKYLASDSGFSESDISFLLDPDLPESIRTFVERYPETISLAANYKSSISTEPQMELNKSEYTDGIPLLIQWDKRWGYYWYGDDYLGTNGCGPACLAMVYAGLSGDYSWSPAKMAEWADRNGYYENDGGTIWAFMSDGAKNFGLTVTGISLTNDQISHALGAGCPIICNMGPGDFTKGGHYIVLAGITDDGMLIINDPNSPVRSSQLWDIETVISQSKAAWSYQYMPD